MSDQHPETSSTETDFVPNFTSDLINTISYTFLMILIWIIFLFDIYPLLLSFGFIGLIGAVLVMVLLTNRTFTVFSRLLGVLAYQSASRKYNTSYMKYKNKCPYLQRKWFTYQCLAEQLAEFDVSVFEKCHKEQMWLHCWPERIPSIIEVFDSHPPKMQQRLIYLLSYMKEYAKSANQKMSEVLMSEETDFETRLAAGSALAEMKEETAIEPLINLLGQDHLDSKQKVSTAITRFGELAIPNIISALQNCNEDDKCGGLAEILGKIGKPAGIPALHDLLKNDSSGENTRFHAMYALQAIDTKEAYESLIEYLEFASEEEKSVIKDFCLSRILVSFPLLIELLTNEDISEEYYSEIGDILAQVQAPRYDKFFTKLGDPEISQRLASILKEHTPEEEEYLSIREVLDKHI